MDNSQSFDQLFRHDFDKVFNALEVAVRRCDFKVESADRNLGRLTAATGMSLTSWGEKLSFSIEEERENRCRLKMTSIAKVGANIASRSRHSKHFDNVLKHMSAFLGAAS